MRKTVVIAVLVLTISSVALFYYFYPWRCINVLIEIDKSTNNSQKSLVISQDEEIYFSNLCNYSVRVKDRDKIVIYNTSCDVEKIKNGLDNFENLSLKNMLLHLDLSSKTGLEESLLILREMYERDFRFCNPFNSYSAQVFLYAFIAEFGNIWFLREEMINLCLYQLNLSDDKKRECLISLLNAEKNILNYLLNFDYSGDVKRCNPRRLPIENLNFYESFNSLLLRYFAPSICEKIIYYRKTLADKVKESNFNFDQKFLLLSSLFLLDEYFGRTQNTTKILIQSLLNEMSQEYRNMIEPIIKERHKFLSE